MTDALAYAIIKRMTEKEILAKIEDYMKKHNLRQYELAKKLGIPESTVNRWLKQKSFKISGKSIYRWNEIKKELNKCQLRCSNCHRLRHYLIEQESTK